MKDIEQIMRDLWERVTELGFVRDGTSDEAKCLGHKVNIGYGAGSIRVRLTVVPPATGTERREAFDITRDSQVSAVIAAIINRVAAAEQEIG